MSVEELKSSLNNDEYSHEMKAITMVKRKKVSAFKPIHRQAKREKKKTMMMKDLTTEEDSAVCAKSDDDAFSHQVLLPLTCDCASSRCCLHATPCNDGRDGGLTSHKSKLNPQEDQLFADDVNEIGQIFDELIDGASESITTTSIDDIVTDVFSPESQEMMQLFANDVDDIARIFDELADETASSSITTKDTPEHQEKILSKKVNDDAPSPNTACSTACRHVDVVEGTKETTFSCSCSFSSQEREMMKAFHISEDSMRRLRSIQTSEKPVLPKLPENYVPFQSFLPPCAVVVDPQCFKPTPFSRGEIDPRIPSIPIPKRDMVLKAPAPPPPPMNRQTRTMCDAHDPSTCDICLSNKSPHRKAILHRWRIRRKRRNWSRGPQYEARSSVALNRQRANGRFVSICKWSS